MLSLLLAYTVGCTLWLDRIDPVHCIVSIGDRYCRKGCGQFIYFDEMNELVVSRADKERAKQILAILVGSFNVC